MQIPGSRKASQGRRVEAEAGRSRGPEEGGKRRHESKGCWAIPTQSELITAFGEAKVGSSTEEYQRRDFVQTADGEHGVGTGQVIVLLIFTVF